MFGKSMVALGAVALAAPLLAAAATSPVTKFGGSCYQYVAVQTTWEAALDLAVEAGDVSGCQTPYLATVTSQDENDFIFNLASTYAHGDPAGHWLGGTDKGTEGVWRWVTGPEFGQIFFGPGAPVGAYSNWAAGEPNDNFGEDHLTGGWFGNTWNDLPDFHVSNYVKGYMVEWAAIPEPATWLMLVAGFGIVGAAARRRRPAFA